MKEDRLFRGSKEEYSKINENEVIRRRVNWRGG